LEKIPAGQRHRLEDEISDDSQLHRISSKLSKWEEKPDLLELKSSDVQIITSKFAKNTARQK